MPDGVEVEHVGQRLPRIPRRIQELFQVREWRHATAILAGDFPGEWRDLLQVVNGIRLPKSMITRGGGNKSPISRSINGMFKARGWSEKRFNVRIHVDDQEFPSPTHGIDYYKNGVGIETEWNNKDPFLRSRSERVSPAASAPRHKRWGYHHTHGRTPRDLRCTWSRRFVR